MKRERKLIQNTWILGLGTLVPKAVLFFSLPIYTSALTKAEYGRYDLMNTVIFLFIPLVTLQIPHAAFRYLVEEKDRFRKLRMIRDTCSLVLPQAALAGAASMAVLQSWGTKVAFLIGCYLFLDVCMEIARQITRGLGHSKAYSVSAIGQSLLQFVLLAVFTGYLRLGLLGIYLSLAVSAASALLYLCWKEKEMLPRGRIPGQESFKKAFLRYGLPLVPGAVSSWVVSLSDRVVVTLVMGIRINAVYSVANKIPQLLNMFTNTFQLAWQESASQAVSDEDTDEYYSRIFDVVFDILNIGAGLLITAAPVLFWLFIDASYREAYSQMLVLFAGAYFYCLAAFYQGIYVAEKKTARIGASMLAAAVLNLALNVLLIPRLGLYAASLSTTVSYAALFYYRKWEVQTFRRLAYPKNKLVKMSAVLAALILAQKIRQPYGTALAGVIAVAGNYRAARKILTGMKGRKKEKLRKEGDGHGRLY